MSDNQSILKCAICGYSEPLPDDWDGNANCPGCKSANTRLAWGDHNCERFNPWICCGLILAFTAAFWGGAYLVIRALMSVGGAE